MLAGICLNNGRPVYVDEGKLLDDQFKGKESIRPLYETLRTEIAAFNPAFTFVPTKLYTSIRDGKEFAVIAVRIDLLRVAIDLGDVPLGDYFQPAKNLGSMPRISHMVSVKSGTDINKRLKDHLVQAHERVCRK
jgi:hypothetical protein